MTTQPAHSEEVFEDGFGTYWVTAPGRTAEEARAIVAQAAGPADEDYLVRSVLGLVIEGDEPQWIPSDEGQPFWEVSEV